MYALYWNWGFFTQFQCSFQTWKNTTQISRTNWIRIKLCHCSSNTVSNQRSVWSKFNTPTISFHYLASLIRTITKRSHLKAVNSISQCIHEHVHIKEEVLQNMTNHKYYININIIICLPLILQMEICKKNIIQANSNTVAAAKCKKQSWGKKRITDCVNA